MPNQILASSDETQLPTTLPQVIRNPQSAIRNRKRLFHYAILLSLVLSAIAAQPQVVAQDRESLVLARVDVQERVDQIPLPVFAHLRGSDGLDYALAIAPLSQIESSGASFSVLDYAAEPGVYIIATRAGAGRQSNDSIALMGSIHVLVDDGRQIVARASEQQAMNLAAAGFEIARFPETPIVWRTASAAESVQASLQQLSVTPIHEVQQMMQGVTQAKLADYVGRLSGESAAVIGGESFTITTRHTNSGTPISKATQFVYEFMQGLGLEVSYHNWVSGRNAVGTKVGTSLPGEIVLITAHIDDMPSSGSAPGADDNASGSGAVMMAAELMSRKLFQRTVRFIFFTGEEQGLLGSNAYASMVSAAGDNIVGVLNLDMIAWNSSGGPVARLHTRTTGNPSGYAADVAIANKFIDVVSAYGLSATITPVLTADGITYSDHSSFWNRGYPAILAIEDDDNDFCAYYHTASDRLSALNLAYYTSFVKAAVGTAAHMTAVNRVSTQDFDGDDDGKADIAVWRPDSGIWYALSSGTPGSWAGTPWGLPTDVPVPGDYDGDARTDIAVFRPDTGIWYALPSASPGTYISTQWGLSEDKPFTGDYDGDRKSDIAVWRPSSGVWHILSSSIPGSYASTPWGLPDDIPVPADYDHDGKSDIAVWRPSSGVWHVLSSSVPGTYTSTAWGLSTDIPAIGDYDGDGKSDIAVWRPSTGSWYVLLSSSPGTYTDTRWGLSTDIPAPGDYDGDGKSDIAVFRPGEGFWYILPSASPGTYTSTHWGIEEDTPISALTPILQTMP
jgi:hypothetical protein